MKFDGTPVTYVNAPGAAGINVNGIVATPDGRYLIIGKRNENRLFRVDLKSREIVPVNMPARRVGNSAAGGAVLGHRNQRKDRDNDSFGVYLDR